MAAAARRLSDAEWDAICDAVAKLLPDADARAEIEHCLFVEFPAFHYDAKRVAAAYQSGRRMLKHCKALADLFAQERAFADDIKHERDLFYIERLRRRAFALVVACQRIRRANSRRANVQHEWLITRLCSIYLDNFNAAHLTVSIPGRGGPPGGPLINFLAATMGLVLPKQRLLGPEGLRDAIRRERQGREHTRQLVLQLEQREHQGVLTREK